MTFLALIIALLLVLAWGSGEPLQEDAWFERWQEQLRRWGLPEGIDLAAAVLGPALLLQLLLQSVDEAVFGLLWIVMAAVVLVYSLGRGDFEGAQRDYRSRCRSGDFEGAYLAAKFDRLAVESAPADAGDVHRLVQTKFLYDGYQRLFAVLFFFLLLGPAGALAYRLLQLCQGEGRDLARDCLAVADWLPARLLAATFAITGDFVRASENLLGHGSDGADDLLFHVGEAALVAAPQEGDQGEWAARQNEEFSQLLKRSAGAWLVLISLGVVLL